MKKAVLFKSLAVFILVLASAQSALAFPIRVTVSGSSQQVVAQACNYYYNGPLYCRVTAYGMLPNGFWINSFTNHYLAPGVCQTAYVYANYPYYFVDGRGTADCNYAY